MRGRRNGKYIAAAKILRSNPGRVIDPAWLMRAAELDRRQADHVLENGEESGLVCRVARGLYVVSPPTTPLTAVAAGKVA